MLNLMMLPPRNDESCVAKLRRTAMPRGVESSAELTGASYLFEVEEYLSLSLEVFNEFNRPVI